MIASRMRQQLLRTGCSTLGLLLGLAPVSAVSARTALLPSPVSVRTDAALLPITGDFDIRTSGCAGNLADSAASRFAVSVMKRVGLFGPSAGRLSLRIVCAPGDAAIPAGDEAYRLSVDAQEIRIDAHAPAGVLRGLATLRQLIVPQGRGFAFTGATIADSPRFAWRGLMIDTARHFISAETLRRQIDAMELVKLNVLHLHLSDNEGFRVESKALPELTAKASHGQYYTQAEIGELVRYAADRGIRIVPEFDMPGHGGAILAAYPELASGPAGPDGTKSVLNPALPQTYRFIDRLVGEMAPLFPDSYFHIGGDEVVSDAWATDPRIKAFQAQHGLASKADLQRYFAGRVRAIVQRHGKMVMGWDELADHDLPRDVLVEAWRSSKQIAHATGLGYRVIVSAGYYLDLLQEAGQHYAVDPLDPKAVGLAADDLARLQKVPGFGTYITDAIGLDPAAHMTPQQEALVMGGEAPLWAELVTDEMLDGRLWPRAAAIAERFWSPATVRDTDDLYRRLAIVTDALRLAGLDDASNRHRMLARLAPGETAPVETFVDLLRTARNGAVLRPMANAMKGKGGPPEPLSFNGLGDAASTDSLVARHFSLDVDGFLAGDDSLAPGLIARLQAWQANHVLFAQVARGKPLLEAALPVSADLADLCGDGLAAITALRSGKPLAPAIRAQARTLLDRHKAAERASATPLAVFLTDDAPPVDDVLIAIAPAIGRLIEHAGSVH